MARFVREKKFETTVGFSTMLLEKRLETMAKLLRGKKV